MSQNQDGSFLHRLLSIRTFENIYRMPRRKPVPNPTGENTDAEDNTGIDRSDGEVVATISQSDSHTRRSSIEDEDTQSTQPVLAHNDNEDRPESLQRTPTSSVSSHSSEIVNSQASAHSVHSLDGADTSSPQTEPPTNQHQEWLPFYLRKGVFIAFAVVLGFMVVALEVLFVISQKHQGLTESYTSLHYLWTYGPTALLTLIQALWNRVDYEAKVTAPWLKANPICTSRDALLMDYVDMFPVAVPFRAFKRRDYPVAAGTTISLLFTMLIVLSTGLFTLSPVELVDTPVPISLKTQFVDDPARLNHGYVLPTYALMAAYANYPYPDGISDQFAYQSFASNMQGVLETRATVDGIYMGLDCAQATVKSIDLSPMAILPPAASPDSPTSYGYSIWAKDNSTMYLEYGDCNTAILFDATSYGIEQNTNLEPDEVPWNLSPGNYLLIAPLKGFTPGHCGSTDIDHNRLVVVSAQIHFKFTNRTEESVDHTGLFKDTYYLFEAVDVQSAAIVCAPDYHITPVDVTRNATGVKSVSPRGDILPRKFPDVHSWDLLHSYLFMGTEWDYYSPIPTFEGNITTNTGGQKFLGVLPADLLQRPQFHLFLNVTFLEDIVTQYNQRFAAIFVAQSFVDQIDIPSTAAALRIADRLLVQTAASQWMVGTMVLIMIILVILSLKPPKCLPSRMEPGSILATAALAGHLTASSFPRDLGAADIKALEARMAKFNNDTPVEHSSPTANETNEAEERQEAGDLASSTETPKLELPLVLRPIFRIIMYILIASCVAVLEVLLHRSNTYQGLGDVQDDTYLHYVWTVLPASIVSAFSLYFSSVDFQTRLLKSYYSLTHVASIDSSLEADLLRPLMPVALYRQIRSRSANTLATSIAALVASMFTIGVASLYQLESLPAYTSMNVRTTSTFTTNCDEDGNAIKYACTNLGDNLWANASSPLTPDVWETLVLEGNLSYTPLVYENLVFPGIALDSPVVNSSQISENTVINLTLPALRPQLSCHWYSDSDITADFFYDREIQISSITNLTTDGLAFNITGEECAGFYYPAPGSTATFMMTNLTAEGLFAGGTDPNENSSLGFGCSRFLFIWGKWSSSAELPQISTTAMGCNATTETLDAVVSFIGPQLQLDPAHPPRPIESTSRAYAKYIPWANTIYRSLSALPLYRNDTIFDAFFETLLTSRYAIPISSLTDPSQAEAIKDAIVFQHGVAVAQWLSGYYRVSTEAPSNRTDGSLFPSLSNLTPTTDTGVYSATASDPYGRRRLVQDPTSTRVVQALLLAALLLSLVGWGLGPGKAVLPRSPTSVASVLALLAGGDVLEYMYKEGDAGASWETVKDAKAVFPDDCKFWMGWGPPGAARQEKERRFGIWMVPF